ncbi:MAG: pilus assembly protein PilM [Planctomycetota bacterium]|nr:pilus assembly protein PilM [Planctomycetota bacterium]
MLKMLNMFHTRKWPIALDIGSDSVKLLQMQRVGSTVMVSACGRWQAPTPAEADAEHRRKLIATAVRDILRSEAFSGRDVISSLSCSQLNIKNVRLPHMPESELAEAVKWEAEERLNLNREADELNYLNAGQVRQGNETRDEIIMLAATSEVVNDHLGLLSEIGLRPKHIDAEPVALFRSFERFLRRRADEQAVSVIADVGQSATRLVVARGRQIIFIKHIGIGGRTFSEAAAKQLNLSFKEACDLRGRIMQDCTEQTYGGRRRDDESAPTPQAVAREASSINWTVYDAVRGEVEALAREIALCLRYCSVTFRGLRPEQITATGGQAYDPAVVKLLAEHLNIPCVMGQPLKGIDVSGVDLGGDRRSMMAEWAVCAGLAMQNANVDYEVQEDEDGESRLSA